MKRLIIYVLIGLLYQPLFAQTSTHPSTLRIAAARSAQDSGLIQFLVDHFSEQYPGIETKVMAVGALQALELGREGSADLIITHHPPSEEMFMEQGYGVHRTRIMYSNYMLFGPPGMLQEFSRFSSITDVLSHIQQREYDFLVPSPRSGTYRKIEELWALAGIDPDWLGYENTGSSAAATLSMTSITGALAIADASLYYLNRDKYNGQVVPLYQGDSILQNNFHAIIVNPEKHPDTNSVMAEAFLEFLVSPQGQKIIQTYTQQEFGFTTYHPAAHLDPNLMARRAQQELKDKQKTLYTLILLTMLLTIMLIFAVLLGFKLKAAGNRQIQAELEKQQLRFDRDIAVQANQVKDEFISVVSHELRTPLTSIIAALGLLKHLLPEGDKKSVELTELAARNSERLLSLINDLLDMEKLVSGSFELKPERFRMIDVIQDVMEEIQPLAKSHNIEHRYCHCDESIYVNADKRRIAQVLFNLLSNAVKHAPENSSIELFCEHIDDVVRVSVADQGSGIPEAFRDRVFDRFTQADSSSRRQHSGTGLGLAIARAIIEQHGGEIGFRDNSPGGTVFYFDLPIARQEG